MGGNGNRTQSTPLRSHPSLHRQPKTIIDFFSPVVIPLVSFLVFDHVLVDDGPDPSPSFDIMGKVSWATPGCSRHTHVYQTNGRYFVLLTPLGGDAKLGGKGFEPQALYIRT